MTEQQPSAPCASSGATLDMSPLEALCLQRPAQRSLMLALVRGMIEQVPRELAQARALWEQGDAGAAKRLVHGARGAVGALGARRFSAQALALETLIGEGDPQPVAAAFACAGAALDDTVRAALAWLAQQPGEPVPGSR